MHSLKASIIEKIQLHSSNSESPSKGNNASKGSPLKKVVVKNINEVISTRDIDFNNPPLYLYDKPSRHMIEESKINPGKDITIKRILNEMESNTLKSEEEKVDNMRRMSEMAKGSSALRSESSRLEEKHNIIKYGRLMSPSIHMKPENQFKRSSLNIKNSSANTSLNKFDPKGGDLFSRAGLQTRSGKKEDVTRKVDNQFWASSLAGGNSKGDAMPAKNQNFPNSRTEQELLLFKEIFVNPKEKRLEELRQTYTDASQGKETSSSIPSSTEQFQKTINPREPISPSEPRPPTRMSKNESAASLSKTKRVSLRASIESLQIEDEHEDENDELSPDPDKYANEDEFDIINIVMKKFNSKAKKKATSSFFVQQIQVQPPEGLNATVAAPLTPGGGWAPSIPSTTSLSGKVSLKDMTMRAKAGVQTGDVQKESHMAFCLGVLNEDNKKYKQAIKFFKRFFFCARLLDDPVGAALALNRLGVACHKSKRYEKSLKFHLKHSEFSDKDNMFAAYYNIGISYRFLRNYQESISYFESALAWAIERQDLESECISLGQLGVTYLTLKDLENALRYFENCYEISQKMKNSLLQLDCLMCLGYIAYDKKSLSQTKEYFHKAYQCAKSLEESEVAEQCLCNVGIATANLQLFEFQNRIKFQIDSDEDEEAQYI